MTIATINTTLLILLYWLPNQSKANTTANVILPSITTDVFDGEDGNCSLREAVYNANNNAQYGSVTGECTSGSNSQTDVIHLQSGAIYTLNLISGSLKLLDNAAVTVDLRLESVGSTTTIQMATPNERVIEIDGASVEMDNLVVSGGSTDGGGGGILNQGMLTMTRTLVQDNQARHGGGILNQGTAVIHDSQILNNTADLHSAGIANVDGGWLTLDNSQIASNIAGQNGGGLYHIDDQSVLTITNSAILSNTATNGDGGEFTAIVNVNPVVTEIITEELYLSVENNYPFAGIYPALTQSLNRFLTVDGLFNQRLVVIPSHFEAAPGSSPTVGTQRLYDSLNLEVYSSPHSESDFVPPELGATTAVVNDGTLIYTIQTTDISGIERVIVLYRLENSNSWEKLELPYNEATQQATIAIPLPSSPIAEYLIQVVDGAGNVAVDLEFEAPYFGAIKLFLPAIFKQ
jgi:hypothetical protein